MSWNDGLTGTALAIAGKNSERLRVMAGPGTGKTYAMTRRVARLLEEGCPPERILAVTFTRTAAADLTKELHSLGIEGCEKVRAGTLHGFCFSVLSSESVMESLHRNPRPLISFRSSQFEYETLLQYLKEREKYGSKRECAKRILAYEAAWARLQSDEPGWPETGIDRDFQSDLLDWLQFHDAMLIGELIPQALNHLRNNPQNEYLGRFDHVIVDEYQDLNRAEQELLDLLSGGGSQFIVGDVDQSIYSFRHAHPEGITTFHERHTTTHDEKLLECRRCPQKVVELANSLILNNHPTGTSTRLNPFATNLDGEIHIVQWNKQSDEAEGISKFVKHLISERSYLPGDILILSSRRQIGQSIVTELLKQDIPTMSFYQDEAMKSQKAQQAFTILTLLANRNDRVALRFWLGCGNEKWREQEYSLIKEYSASTGLSPWIILEKLSDGSIVIDRTKKVTSKFQELQSILRQLEALEIEEVIDKLFPESETELNALREIALGIDGEELDCIILHEKMQTILTQPEIPEESEAVRVMSFYKSKGLSSKVVILAGCNQRLIPSTAGMSDQLEIEKKVKEDRRLFYVGMTRARELLVISSFSQIEKKVAHKMNAHPSQRGGMTAKIFTSQFVTELGRSSPQMKLGQRWTESSYQ